MPNHSSLLHQRALRAAREFKSAEAELIAVIRQIDEAKLFRERGHSSLFQYVVSELGLSESTTYSFISVARKSREIPELAQRIEEKSISVSQARKIVPVLTRETSSEWLLKASQLSQRQLEKAVASMRPETKTPERASYVSATRVRLELGLSETEMLRLRRVQDVLSQNRRRAVSLEETLSTLTQEYLSRHDPTEKAKRHQVRKGGLEYAEAELKAVSRSEGPKPPTQSNGSNGIEHGPSSITNPREFIPHSLSKPESIQVHQATRSSFIETENKIFSNEKKSTLKRTPIPNMIKHQVHLRDQGQCTHRNSNDQRCNQRRWLEIHHIHPVSQGGTHTLENLATLCSNHHRFIHRAYASS
jgi:hypothetical protein